jgi:hypothetical protein
MLFLALTLRNLQILSFVAGFLLFGMYLEAAQFCLNIHMMKCLPWRQGISLQQCPPSASSASIDLDGRILNLQKCPLL